jgi:hypothetical protein
MGLLTTASRPKVGQSGPPSLLAEGCLPVVGFRFLEGREYRI